MYIYQNGIATGGSGEVKFHFFLKENISITSDNNTDGFLLNKPTQILVSNIIKSR